MNTLILAVAQFCRFLALLCFVASACDYHSLPMIAVGLACWCLATMLP